MIVFHSQRRTNSANPVCV